MTVQLPDLHMGLTKREPREPSAPCRVVSRFTTVQCAVYSLQFALCGLSFAVLRVHCASYIV